MEAEAPQEHRIRITLTSKNVKPLEKGEHRLAGHLRHGARPRGSCSTRRALLARSLR